MLFFCQTRTKDKELLDYSVSVRCHRESDVKFTEPDRFNKVTPACSLSLLSSQRQSTLLMISD